MSLREVRGIPVASEMDWRSVEEVADLGVVTLMRGVEGEDVSERERFMVSLLIFVVVVVIN